MSLVLPMLDVHRQTFCRGTVNSAYTQLRSTGVEDATVTIWRAVHDYWSRRSADDAFLGAIDGLASKTLADAISARLAAMPELTDASFDPAGLRKRYEILSGLRAGNISRIARSAASSATELALEFAERLRKTLDGAFAATPHSMRDTIDQTRAALAAITWPEPASRPHTELANLVRALDEIATRRSAFTANSHEAILAQLVHRARRASDEALQAVAVDYAARASRQAVGDVDGYLDELTNLHTQFDENNRAVQAHLESLRTAAAAQHRVLRASVIVPLEGADEREVLAGMIAHQGCADLQQLAAELLDRFAARLRELAASHYPWLAADAPLARLVAAIHPREAADAFASLIRQSLGPGHSLYQVIDQYGIAKLARELYERAAHTCHLRGRDNERFNVSTQQMAIVRLPRPVGAADFEIHKRLCVAFERLPDCTVTDGAPDDKDITVVRLHQGWLLAIEHNNPALLQRYVESAAAGHRPHLLGILDDSPTGEVIPDYCDLAEILNPDNL